MNVSLSNTTLSPEDALWQANEKVFKENLPVVIYLSILMTVGVTGNILVVYTYSRYFRKTTGNFYILTLSIFDIIAGFMLTLEVLDRRYPMYSGQIPALCKTVRLVEFVTNGSSMGMLICIAIDRYYKVCYPMKCFTMNQAKKLLALQIVIIILVTWPIALFNGQETKKTDFPNVYGKDCADDDSFANSTVSMIYFGTIFAIYLVSFVVLVVMYSRIYRAIWKWKKTVIGETLAPIRKRSSCISSISETWDENFNTAFEYGNIRKRPSDVQVRDNSPITLDMTSDCHDNPEMNMSVRNTNTEENGGLNCKQNVIGDEEPRQNSDQVKSKYEIKENVFINVNKPSVSQILSSESCETSKTTSNTSNLGLKNPALDLEEKEINVSQLSTNCDDRQLQRKQRRQSDISMMGRRRLSSRVSIASNKSSVKMTNSTFIFCVVTISYICAYMPYFVIEGLNATGILNFDDLSLTKVQIVRVLNSSFVINNAVNPIIYSILNPHFRYFVRNIFTLKQPVNKLNYVVSA